MKDLEYSFERPIKPEDLSRLMDQTSWGRGRTLTGLRTMLSMSPVKLGVWDGHSLIGFCRAISDGVYRCVIEDVIVDEPCHEQGIATRIVELMKEKLAGIEHIYLFGLFERTLYRRQGFDLTPYDSMRILTRQCP
mgnify:FL=1